MLHRIIQTKMGSREQRGDTIVEVLIAIAVVSLVLAGAYAVTNRNLATTQDTQEHGQALFVAQQQVEGLRALSASGTVLTSAFPANQCVNLSSTPPVPTSGNPCKIAPDGTTCNPATVTTACFTILITQPIASTYNVAVTWTTVHGSTAKVSMDYGI